ncbi:MAG: response regulator [Gemmatimonadaceae bacterium]
MTERTTADKGALAARLLATFLDELDEQLRALDADLLALERDPADAEHLKSVFRIAHTLKGASRAAGVNAIEEVCHELEAMCAVARDAGTPLAGSQISLLFAGSDALADAGRMLREGRDARSSPVVVELLQQLRRRASGADSSERARPAPIIPVHDPDHDRRLPGPEPDRRSPRSAVEGPAMISGPSPVERDDQIRVGARQLDSLVTVAGELLGMTGMIGDRPAAVEALAESIRGWRGEWERTAGAYQRSLVRSGASPTLIAAMAAVDSRLVHLDRQVGELARAIGEDARSLGGTTSRLVENVGRLRMRPFSDIAEKLPRAARDVAATLGKQVQVVVEGQEVEADRTVLDTLREPLLHLVRNAIDHGIGASADRIRRGKKAEGSITVRAELGGDRLRITVSDDGAGLDVDSIRALLKERGRSVPADDRDVARTLFESGFSTRRVATNISGRGVGLDIVRTAVERLGGTVNVQWVAGAGTTFTIQVPVSVATLRALLVLAGRQMLAIPTTFLERVMRVSRGQVRLVEGRTMLTIGSEAMPLTSLARLLGPPLVDPPPEPDLNIIILAVEGRRLAIAVDEMCEEREIVVRPLEHAGDEADLKYSGAALLDGTRIALVVNANALVSSAGRDGGRDASMGFAIETIAPPREWHILVVDDSITTRTLEESVLTAAGYRVTTAVNGVDALRLVEEGGVDLVVSDVEMPRLDGLGLTERIRATAAHAKLPVILVTSLDKPEARARGLEAGADAYIMKSSFDQDTLLGIVRQLLGDAA